MSSPREGDRMQALILAAGRGSRMGARTANRPKCLLEVGGRALIEHQLEALAECGVGPVGLVVGYRAEDIREIVGIGADYIENDRWRNTNSLYSFALARDWVKDDLLVLNSDLLFDPAIIERLLAASEDCLAFDSGSGHGVEHMKVDVRDGKLVEMSKKLPQERVGGENVGILRFSRDTAASLFDRAEETLAEDEQCWLGAAVSELARRKPIEAVDIAGLAWAEIDFPYDLQQARKSVWPRIRRPLRWSTRLRSVSVAAATVTAAVVTTLLVQNSLATTPQPTQWEPIEPVGVESVQIEAENREQRWWTLDRDDEIDLHAEGPVRVRVESRLRMEEEEAPVRFALAIDLEGRPLKWEDHLAETSSTWRLSSEPLSKREKIEFDVPEGEGRLRIRLVSPDSEGALIRIAQVVPELEDD